MVRRLSTTLLVLLCFALFGARLSAQSDRMAPGPAHESNLRTGELPPTNFTLPSATDGEIYDLEAQRGEQPLLLLFFRGTW